MLGRTGTLRTGLSHRRLFVLAAAAWIIGLYGCVSEPMVEQPLGASGTITADSTSVVAPTSTSASPSITPTTTSPSEPGDLAAPSVESLSEAEDETAAATDDGATDTTALEVETYVEPIESDASARGVLLADGTRSRRSEGQFLSVEAGGNHSCAIRLDETVMCWGANGLNQLESPDGAFAQISAGTNHSCGVRTDNSLVCWGFNGYELAEPPAGDFESVSASDTHSCALRVGGAVSCWGWDILDRLDPPEGEFASVSVGAWTSCGLRLDGSIECWGADWWGMQDVPSGSFSQIAVSIAHACGVRDDGTVTCWGLQDCSESQKVREVYNPYHHKSNTSTGYGLYRCWLGEPSADSGQVDAPSGAFDSVGVTIGHSCGVREDGAATCWGTGRHGGLSRGESRWVPDDMGIDYSCIYRVITEDCVRIGNYSHSDVPSGGYISISGGRGHSCGLHVDGTVECWGDNFYGEIDIPEPTEVDRPSPTGTPESGFVDVSAGFGNSCGLKEDGRILCWGQGWSDHTEPPNGALASVSVGGGHACGLLEDGAPLCWGLNDYGQADPPSGQFSKISAGSNHTCGVLRSGLIECWGDDSQGQAEEPVGTFVDVAAGDFHNCALRADATVECWGENSLAYGKSASDSPHGQFIAIAAYGHASCGVVSDGAMTCWGWDAPFHGEVRRESPFVAVSTGYEFACGLHADASVSCYGRNTVDQTRAPDGPFTAIASTGWHSCALRPGGTVECWGSNSVGESDPP